MNAKQIHQFNLDIQEIKYAPINERHWIALRPVEKNTKSILSVAIYGHQKDFYLNELTDEQKNSLRQVWILFDVKQKFENYNDFVVWLQDYYSPEKRKARQLARRQPRQLLA